MFSISEFYLMTQDLMHMSEHVVIIWKSIFENVLTLFLTQDWLYSDKSPPGKVDGKKNDVVLDRSNQNWASLGLRQRHLHSLIRRL